MPRPPSSSSFAGHAAVARTAAPMYPQYYNTRTPVARTAAPVYPQYYNPRAAVARTAAPMYGGPAYNTRSYSSAPAVGRTSAGMMDYAEMLVPHMPYDDNGKWDSKRLLTEAGKGALMYPALAAGTAAAVAGYKQFSG